MLEHTTDAMRQSGGKQDTPHAHAPSGVEHVSPPDPRTANPSHPHDSHQSRGDLASAADQGMSCHPHDTEAPHAPPRRPAQDADPGLPAAPTVAQPPVEGERRHTWLTLADVAEELCVSTRTVMRWAERGELPVVVLPGGRKRVRRDLFDAWLASLTRGGGRG
jgi:excisionase family DNA binding protein